MKMHLFTLTAAVLALSPTRSQSQSSTWRALGGPYRPEVVGIVKSSSGKIFTATKNKLFRSIDNGLSWSSISLPSEESPMRSLVAGPSGFVATIAGGMIVRSTDDGETWNEVSNDALVSVATTLHMSSSPALPGLLIAGTDSGTFHTSSDFGATWTRSPLPALPGAITAVFADQHGTIFAGTRCVINNYGGGRTQGAPTDPNIEPAKHSSADSPYGPGGMYRSVSNRTGWVLADSSIIFRNVSQFLQNADQELLACTHAIEGPYPVYCGVGLEYENRTETLSDFKVVRWTNETAFLLVNTPEPDAEVRTIAIGTNGVILCGTQSGSIARSTDGGNTWGQYRRAIVRSAVVGLLPLSQGVWLAGTEVSGIFRSTDDGLTWVESNAGLEDGLVRVTSIASNGQGRLVVGTSNRGVLVASSADALDWEGTTFSQGRSWKVAISDAGTAYTILLPNLMRARPEDNGRYETAQLPPDWSSPTALIVGSNNRLILAGRKIHYSDDEGSTWTSDSFGDSYNESSIRQIVRNSKGTLLATYGVCSFLKSTDNGVTWTAYDAPVAGSAELWYPRIAVGEDGVFVAVNDNAELFVSDGNGSPLTRVIAGGIGHYYGEHSPVIGHDGRVYLATSSDGLLSASLSDDAWRQELDGLPDAEILSIATLPSGAIVVGTGSNGLYTNAPGSSLSVESDQTTPNSFRLEQNYPNPFNPTTEISFVSPFASHISLKIFDLLGREVAVLVNEEMPAGMHSVTWNATGFPSGVFVARLEADRKVLAMKLLLAK